MRFCNKNKVDIWYTPSYSVVDELDDEGFFTGNTTISYEKPILRKVNFYPATGSIATEIFGENVKLDYVIIDDNEVFNEYTVFFLKEPDINDDIGETYDYYIGSIVKSLNHTQYGLVKRA